MSTVTADEDAPKWAVRLEAKVDVALATHGTAIDTLGRDLSTHVSESSQTVESIRTDMSKQDERIDALERANYITPKMLATAIASTIAVVAGFLELLDRLPT